MNTQIVSAVKFTAPVVYVQPSFEELKGRFPAYVNPDYHVGPEYKGECFDPIELCETCSKQDREIIFEYVHLGRGTVTNEILAEMDHRGLRPALYEELLGFAEKYPDEQCKYLIVALGSEAWVDCGRHVAYLWDVRDGRRLDLCRHTGWDGRVRFLAVRE